MFKRTYYCVTAGGVRHEIRPIRMRYLYSDFRGWEEMIKFGRFPFSQNVGISGSAVNGTRFVGSSHWNIPRKSGKSKKVGPFSWLEFPNGMSCSIYVSRSLYQFQVHGRTPRRAGVYDQMKQLFTNRKFHFLLPPKFPVVFPKWKAPDKLYFSVRSSSWPCKDY